MIFWKHPLHEYILSLRFSRVVVNAINKFLSFFGIRLTRIRNLKIMLPVEFEQRDRDIFNYVFDNKLTMVSVEHLVATIQACKYVLENNIEGDFVECGVWRGGNSIAAKLIFEAYGSNKKVFLYDTFTGMTAPSEIDKTSLEKNPATPMFLKCQKKDHNTWCYSSFEEVKQNFKDAKVNVKDIRFIKGNVLETLTKKKYLPNKIAVLRLDTDWYELTKIEMEVLYPLLSKNGVLIIDDFGHWVGSQKAVDEYFFKNSKLKRPLLQCTGTGISGRMGTKL